MPIFEAIDGIAAIFFVLCWAAYSWLVDHSPWRHGSLTAAMNAQRRAWMETMSRRENRMLDAQVVNGLQSGSAFFASTSLLAIGAAFALLTASEQVLGVVGDLPLGLNTSRTLWEIKALGVLAIYAYAFFKFGWSYRLFNYVSILIGATPGAEDADSSAARLAVKRATEVAIIAGRHFSRGQRAFFFSVGFLGWFAGPWVFLGVTLIVVLALCGRQFAFPALPLLRER
jgi:uncharacterized membrane protein